MSRYGVDLAGAELLTSAQILHERRARLGGDAADDGGTGTSAAPSRATLEAPACPLPLAAPAAAPG
eukprot:16080726-Heterocapsa_arctica.AAC.1